MAYLHNGSDVTLSNVQSPPQFPTYTYTVIHHYSTKGDLNMSDVRGCGIGGFGGCGGFTSTGVILVLFILLVIISRSFLF